MMASTDVSGRLANSLNHVLVVVQHAGHVGIRARADPSGVL